MLLHRDLPGGAAVGAFAASLTPVVNLGDKCGLLCAGGISKQCLML